MLPHSSNDVAWSRDANRLILKAEYDPYAEGSHTSCGS